LAWVGLISGASVTAADFTASGDNVNIAARLAYKAGTGEVFIGETTWDASKFGLK
jgi:class 3 adenylate cyclase